MSTIQASATVITFKLIEFNSHRLMRSATAAKVAIFQDGEQINWLWMTPRDIHANRAEFGPSEAFDQALAQYRAHGVLTGE